MLDRYAELFPLNTALAGKQDGNWGNTKKINDPD
jgi:hypothetical protein